MHTERTEESDKHIRPTNIISATPLNTIHTATTSTNPVNVAPNDPLSLLLANFKDLQTNLMTQLEKNKSELTTQLTTEMNTQLNLNHSQLTTEINTQLSKVESSLTEKLNNLHEESKLNKEYLMNLITITNNETLGHVNTVLSEHTNLIEGQTDKKLSIFLKENTQQLDNFEKKLNTNFQNDLANHSAAVSTKLTNFKEDLPNQIKEITQPILDQQYEYLQLTIEDRSEALLTQITENKTQLGLTNEMVNQHSKVINENTSRINILDKQMENLNSNQSNLSKITHTNKLGLPEITIHCPGSHTTEFQSNVPKFHDRQKNPIDFLNKFDKYYQSYLRKQGDKESLSYIEAIEFCFPEQQSNYKWYNLIKEEVKDEADFKARFLRQFWSPQTQRLWKRKIEQERYNEKSRLTRAEYLIDRTLILKSILPPMNDEEIVLLLSDHFNSRIHDAIIVQGIQSIDRFIDLLNREDLENNTERNRRPTTEPNPNRHTEYRNPSHRPNQNTQQAQNNQYDVFNNYIPRPKFTYNEPRSQRDNTQQHSRNYNHPNMTSSNGHYNRNHFQRERGFNQREHNNGHISRGPQRTQDTHWNDRGNQFNPRTNYNSQRETAIRHIQLHDGGNDLTHHRTADRPPDPDMTTSRRTNEQRRLLQQMTSPPANESRRARSLERHPIGRRNERGTNTPFRSPAQPSSTTAPTTSTRHHSLERLNYNADFHSEN